MNNESEEDKDVLKENVKVKNKGKKKELKILIAQSVKILLSYIHDSYSALRIRSRFSSS